MRASRPPILLVGLAALLGAGCAFRQVHEGPEAFERLRPPEGAAGAAATVPAALAGVVVNGEDLRSPYDDRWLVWIPFVPFARSGQAVVRASELGPEIEQALWPRFRNRPGDRRLVLRCALERGRVEEVRTLYGLSVVGIAICGVFGPPLKYMEATAAARFDLVDADAPPGAAPLFGRAVEGVFRARAGVAGLFLWYNTDVTPRDMVYEAWANAIAEFVAALPPPSSPLWRGTGEAAGATGPDGR